MSSRKPLTSPWPPWTEIAEPAAMIRGPGTSPWAVALRRAKIGVVRAAEVGHGGEAGHQRRWA